MVVVLIVAVAVAFIVLERLWPAAKLPAVEGWWARVALLNFAQFGIVLLAGQTWDRWFRGVSLWHLSRHMNAISAGLITYVVSCLIFYWWHRFRHESQLFWRLCHQLHHSPRRIEVLTSFYKHPVEITLNSMITSAITYPLLGCDTRGAAAYLFLTAAAEYFYHWNLRTPRWVGWLIQRPEAHRVHHQRNRHSMNYGDLPVLDWLFGTLHNPRTQVPACGFDAEREARFGEMLVGRDVHKQQPVPICFGCSKRW